MRNRPAACPHGVGVVLALLLAVGCAPSVEEQPAAGAGAQAAAFEVRPIDLPAAAGAFAPDLAVSGGELLATWVEPVPAPEGAKRHRVRFARWNDGVWSEAATIAEGDDLFANWADFPAAVAAADGTLWAHWLEKTAADTYAYSIFLARSGDGGRTWEPRGLLNDDATPTEHGFVSWVPDGEGVRAFWLDGREMAAGGPMTLRSAAIAAAGELGASELLDDRVCECCATGAAATAEGVMVVYRNRDEAEVRDIFGVRGTAQGWSRAEPLSGDGWTIAGCPVNGPEIDAAGARVAVAWFTGAGGAPTVKAAFSEDAGATFGAAAVVDGDSPLGRVAIALAEGGAWVSWLHQAGERAEVRLRWVGEDGRLGDPGIVAITSPARASGFPRLAALDGRLLMAWVEVGEGGVPTGVRMGEVKPPVGG